MSKARKAGTRWARCLVALSVRVTGRDQVEHFWPGLVVNLDREIAPGFSVGDALQGRIDCVEACGDPSLAVDVEVETAPAAPVGKE